MVVGGGAVLVVVAVVGGTVGGTVAAGSTAVGSGVTSDVESASTALVVSVKVSVVVVTDVIATCEVVVRSELLQLAATNRPARTATTVFRATISFYRSRSRGSGHGTIGLRPLSLPTAPTPPERLPINAERCHRDQTDGIVRGRRGVVVNRRKTGSVKPCVPHGH